ncbi:MAG: DUF4907 domain-containing protein [Pedobacter sp.]|nr:DUF4907 domain-containing protein [Chitinophagaceae bacterium]
MIKKNWIYILFAVAVIVFVIKQISKTSNNDNKQEKRLKLGVIKVGVISVDSGFGYIVYSDTLPMIKQPFIPAIEGDKAFINEDQAKRTGELVVYKIKHNLLPTVSISELDSLHITR